MFKHIIVPIDGSDCSLRAADVAGTLARELGAECVLCVAIDVVPPTAIRRMPSCSLRTTTAAT